MNQQEGSHKATHKDLSNSITHRLQQISIQEDSDYVNVFSEEGLHQDSAEEHQDEPSQTEQPQTNWLKNYLPMGIGQVLSMLGSALVQFALVWYITKETGSALSLLSATLTGTLPRVFLGPFAGALVDRWNRKLTMIVSDGVIALATIVLSVLFATNHIQLWHIYAMLFIRSVGGIFQGPAMTASIALMIPKAHYTRLAGITQAAEGIITIISPPLGALMMSLLPIQAVLGVDIITAALAILLLLTMVKIPQPPNQLSNKVEISVKTVLRDVKEGFQAVVSWKGVLLLLICGTLINMTSAPAFSLLPLHVEKYFQKGPEGLALLYSALGVGSIIGGLILGVWGGFKRKVFTVVLGIMNMGIGLIVFGLLPQEGYRMAIVAIAYLGIMSAFANGPLNAIMQEKIPPEMQGRVFTLLSSLIQATVPIGLLIAAPIAELLGIQIWYITAGVVCLLVGFFGIFSKHLSTLDFQGPGGVIMPQYQDK